MITLAVIDGEDIIVETPAHAEMKEIGARWDARRNAWKLPATLMNARQVFALDIGAPDLSGHLMPPRREVDDDRMYPFQREAIARLVRARHGQLAVVPPGHGKTALAITAADIAVPDDTIVVVTLASLVPTWEREIARWGKVPGRVYAVTSKLDPDEATGARWIIISWDRLVREKDVWGKGWPLFILDESVLAKSRGSKRFKALSKIRSGVARVWLLSASPTTRHADDLWAQLNLVWPRAFPSYWRFTERYCVTEDTPWGKKVLDDRTRMDPIADNADLVFVVGEEEAGLDLPEYLFEPPLVVPLAGRQLKAYESMRDDFVAELGNGIEVIAENEITKLMKLQQIASWWDGESAKHDALLDVIAGYRPPYLLWTHWRDGATALAERLVAAGISTLHVAGGLSVVERDKRLEDFKSNGADALVLSLGVGKFGHTFTNVRTIGSVDRTFNADDYFQSMHRVRRIGLTHHPVVLPLVARATVDELTVGDNLEAKLKSISKMTRANLAALLKGIGR